MIDQDAYAEAARLAVNRLVTSQRTAIAAAGCVVADALMARGVLQAYGTGHSRAVALELVGRVGGLVPANQLAIRDLVYYGGAPPGEILDPLLERSPELAARIWALAEIRPPDVFLIASTRAATGAVVEMARLASDRGHPLIAITSLAHTRDVASRHPSGLRLAGLADVVVDNCALLRPGRPAARRRRHRRAVQPDRYPCREPGGGRGRRPLPGRRHAAPSVPVRQHPGGDEHNAGMLTRHGGRVRLGDA